MEEMLLVENWGQPATVSDIQINESKADLPPGLYIEGVFLQAEVVNGNKRLYPKAVLEKAVSKYVKEQMQTKQALGELNHPSRPFVDPERAALLIESMWWEGNNVMGRARIIEGDNGPGDKLAANIRAGWLPGVSSRGLGSVADSGKGHKIVQEGFRLTVGVDAVWGPSAPDAIVKPIEINESVKSTPDKQVPDKSEPFKKLLNNLTRKSAL